MNNISDVEHDELHIESEDLLELTASPGGAYVALFANPIDRTVDRIPVDFFAIYRQRWSNGEVSKAGFAAVVENDGSVVTASSFDDFIGVVRADDIKDGLPRWAIEDLQEYLTNEVDN